jgi:hypothetical protein
MSDRTRVCLTVLRGEPRRAVAAGRTVRIRDRETIVARAVVSASVVSMEE